MLAEELSRLRSVSGRSLAALSDLTTYDRAYLHKLETGMSSGSPEVMAALDAVYGTGRHLRDLWKLAQQEIHPDKYKRFMERERQATSRHQYAFGILPGLLQTKGYMQELFESQRSQAEKARSRHITVRLARQAMVRGDNPQHYRVILDESVLHRQTKDKQVWQDQLAALVDAAEAPHIRIQVLPFSAGLHGLLGESLTLLRLRTGKLIAYLEATRWADLIEEPNQVEQLHLTYDLLRDSALTPSESADYLKDLMKSSTSSALDNRCGTTNHRATR
ncbi:helix-turn-helix transcriptional regulator [Streptomyces uncialis]|uniref:helix-turn-helix domain-containing protein n=1 Tax=Streptomyces uncialis TaxID=1048205 RepID=UPI0022541368|nr:helix-turn-helix transcriptional regulator [Streptomyces uncialis]MCX4663718.1 helix-turn-helix domain-containing protein [Streptomyces uncialis]WST70577.1 helix-turn-helix domain-containing protein [Streptomyces uncialis]